MEQTLTNHTIIDDIPIENLCFYLTNKDADFSIDACSVLRDEGITTISELCELSQVTILNEWRALFFQKEITRIFEEYIYNHTNEIISYYEDREERIVNILPLIENKPLKYLNKDYYYLFDKKKMAGMGIHTVGSMIQMSQRGSFPIVWSEKEISLIEGIIMSSREEILDHFRLDYYNKEELFPSVENTTTVCLGFYLYSKGVSMKPEFYHSLAARFRTIDDLIRKMYEKCFWYVKKGEEKIDLSKIVCEKNREDIFNYFERRKKNIERLKEVAADMPFSEIVKFADSRGITLGTQQMKRIKSTIVNLNGLVQFDCLDMHRWLGRTNIDKYLGFFNSLIDENTEGIIDYWTNCKIIEKHNIELWNIIKNTILDDLMVFIRVYEFDISAKTSDAMVLKGINTTGSLLRATDEKISDLFGNGGVSYEILKLKEAINSMKIDSNVRNDVNVLLQIKDVSLDNTPLLSKEKKSLSYREVQTIGELVRMTRESIRSLYNCGEKTTNHILSVIDYVLKNREQIVKKVNDVNETVPYRKN